MRPSVRLLAESWKFLPNRSRIIFKSQREAFKDFLRVSGANILWQLGLAALIFEFAFPTPDIVYDAKRLISPDFDLFCKYGEIAEFDLGLQNKIRALEREQIREKESRINEKSPEHRFGGII